VRRRSFDHLHAELSVELGIRVPRYALWIAVQEAGLDPDLLDSHDTTRFFDEYLPAFLDEAGLALSTRGRKRLRRRILRFDPHRPTPYETMERMFGDAR